jgi:hypothetical protein
MVTGIISPDIKLPTSSLRRPLLSGLSATPGHSVLTTFLTHISLNSYESLYNSRGNIDWSEVDASLLSDIFSG